MNRLGFLKRLGALAVTAVVAEPILEALAAPVINKSNIMTYNIVHNGTVHHYWMNMEEYYRILEYQKELEARLFGLPRYESKKLS